ncbi:MAG: hypothetical protein EAZ89_18850 [Bacteroidetes bacterium]|nr:MAG: hypothetical protein EAZ89_18850 [Bacteroidota bacterium]
MKSFRSRNYPRSSNALLVGQEFAMQYYAALTLIIMLGLMVRVVSGGVDYQLLLWALGAEVLAVLLGNALSNAKMRRTLAEIFFVKEHFSLISVYDILHKKESHVFPLAYASARRSADGKTLSLHYHDQILTLNEADWGEDFEEVCSWLFSLGMKEES